ncbi:hypothetical protein GPECTOR_1g147 [Gonium pectorale]|uniref:Uncharacterized protein n=1 Tax=Gonium pectorale TaxID=33097 RepID=A0A150H239_GONPE|nr:hypothetical protein GPECTOR_1g147 [Gonium pectorale]|eukprot:KXZ56171.1 hypothetical protein GPECTOR_1g147 [Gonium pectorale]
MAVGPVSCTVSSEPGSASIGQDGRFLLPINNGTLHFIGGCKDYGSGATYPDGILQTTWVKSNGSVASPIATLALALAAAQRSRDVAASMRSINTRLGLDRDDATLTYNYLAETQGPNITMRGVSVALANFMAVGTVVNVASLFRELYGVSDAESMEAAVEGLAYYLSMAAVGLDSTDEVAFMLEYCLDFLIGTRSRRRSTLSTSGQDADGAWADPTNSHADASVDATVLDADAARWRRQLYRATLAAPRRLLGVDPENVTQTLAMALAEANMHIMNAMRNLTAVSASNLTGLSDVLAQGGRVAVVMTTNMASATAQLGSGALTASSFTASYTGAGLTSATGSAVYPYPGDSKKKTPIGLIVGVAVGGAVGLALVVVMVALLVRRRNAEVNAAKPV